MQPTGDQGRELAQRLRSLREGSNLTQTQLARALSVSVPLISGWESQKATPPTYRLEAYATFFATARSKARDGVVRRVTEAQLTDQERAQRESLLSELMTLRTRAVKDGDAKAADGPTSTWHFPDLKDITIVCAPLSEKLRSGIPYADPDNPHFVETYRYADLDALIELHGHLRAFNPQNQVNIRLPFELTEDDLTTHLVLLGGVDWNDLTRDLQERMELPVRQVSKEAADPEILDAWFEVTEDGRRREFRPRLGRAGTHNVLLQDVAYFYRATSPFNNKRTITVCNAMYGRGVYGAVRTLTDTKFRDRNEDRVLERFGGREQFSVLMRVQIFQNKVITPDWTQANMRLHEWPEAGR
jgi:transcriptional regulator with XRE-family HTH domain